MAPEEDNLLTFEEVAERLRISNHTAYKLIHKEKLSFIIGHECPN